MRESSERTRRTQTRTEVSDKLGCYGCAPPRLWPLQSSAVHRNTPSSTLKGRSVPHDERGGASPRGHQPCDPKTDRSRDLAGEAGRLRRSVANSGRGSGTSRSARSRSHSGGSSGGSRPEPRSLTSSVVMRVSFRDSGLFSDRRCAGTRRRRPSGCRREPPLRHSPRRNARTSAPRRPLRSVRRSRDRAGATGTAPRGRRDA